MFEALLGFVICFYPGPIVPAFIAALIVGFVCFCRPWAGLILIVFLLPLGNLDYSMTFGSITIRMFQLCAVPTGLGWLMHILAKDSRQSMFKWSPINHMIAVMTFWLLFSLLWADGIGGWVSKNIQWVLSLLLFFMSLSLMQSRTRIKQMIMLWICVGVVTALIAFLQFLTQGVDIIMAGGVPERWGTVRSASILKEPNDLALFLRYPLIILLSVYGCLQKGSEKLAAFAAMGIMMGGVLFTFSRGATLSLGGGVFLMAMRHVRLRKTFLWGLLVVIFVVLVSGKGMIVYQSVASRIGSSFDILLSDQAIDEDVGYLVRVDNWAAGLSIFMDNPVLGVGPGGYQGQAKKMLSSSQILSDFGLHSDKPYNLYLDILVSYGLVGFAIFFALIAAILYCCLKGSRSGNDVFLQNILFGGAVIIIIMLVKGLTGEVFFESGQLWLFLGLIMSVLNLGNSQQTTYQVDCGVKRGTELQF